jgi:outer membrane receptor for ferric coprogen and ferric-rhodotorulic acid
MHKIAALSSCPPHLRRKEGSRSSGKVGPFLSSLALALCLPTVIAKGADLQTEYRFAIQAQALDTALLAFSDQSKVQVLMSAKPQSQASSPGVAGSLSARAALAAILDDTGFAFKEIDHETVAIIAPSGDPMVSTRSGVGAAGADHLEQAAPTNAETTEQKSSESLVEVVVQGYRFLSADTSGTTNLPIPIEKVPQSISLVSGDFIKAAALQTYGDVAEYTPGVLNVGNQNGYTTLIDIRGFPAGRAVDGLSILGTSNTDLDATVIDRLEVVKGPSSVVYGISNAGGLVNTVTKSATPDTRDYLYVQAYQWDGFRVEGQAAGALDSDGHVRVIGALSRDQGDSFQNNLSHSTNSFYGGIDATLPHSFTASLHAGYSLFLRTGFDGIPVYQATGDSANLPRSFCVCVKDMDLRSATAYGSAALAWHPTSMLDLSLKAYFENRNTTGSINPYSYNLQPNGTVNISVQQATSGTAVNTAEGVNAIYHLDDLGAKGSFLSVGFHREDFWSNGSGVSYQAGTATTNIFEGQAAFDQFIESIRPLMISNPFVGPRLITATTGGVQALLQLSNPLALLLGASYSKPYASSITEGVYSAFKFAGKASYRAGLTYTIAPPLTAYLSYSQSFQPQIFYEPNFVPVPPLVGEQYEAGLKYTNHRVLLTAAVYQLTQANSAQYFESIKNADFYLPLGQVKNKGFELGAVGQITDNWKVNAGYAYLDPKISEDTTASLVGQTQLWLPWNTGSAFLVYTFNQGLAQGLSFGVGGRFVGSVHTSYDRSTRDIPGYSVADVNIGYARDKWLVNLNVRNVLGEHYLINEWQTLYYGNSLGAPANFSLSARYEF